MKFCVSERCIGCNCCAIKCPEVFFMNENEKAEAIQGDVPQEVEQRALEAMNGCPVDAIEQTD